MVEAFGSWLVGFAYKDLILRRQQVPNASHSWIQTLEQGSSVRKRGG